MILIATILVFVLVCGYYLIGAILYAAAIIIYAVTQLIKLAIAWIRR